MICGQLFWSQLPSLFDHVPLSCVPPWTSHELEGLIATPMNCSVSRFRSVWVVWFGTFDSIRMQFARLAAPSSGRSFELQRDEMSANEPSVRTTPPSEP